MKMNLVQRTLGKIFARSMKYAGVPLRDPALASLFGFTNTTAGIHVNEDVASTIAAYTCGVTLIADCIAMMELKVQHSDGKGGWVDENDHLGTLLMNVVPNPNTIPYTARQYAQTEVLTWGNCYYKVERANGFPVAIYNMPAAQVVPRYDDNKNIVYDFSARNKNEKDEVIPAHDMIHIPGMGFNGLQGKSIVSYARESLALTVATEKHGAAFFGNGAMPSGVITSQFDLGEIGRDNLRKDFEEKTRGPNKARGVVILDEGMKYTSIAIPPDDSQFLETRKFQIIEIARWLRIPPHKLFELEGSTFNSLEIQNLDFLMFTLYPWMTRWIQELNRKLLDKSERVNKRFAFDPSVFLRMDTLNRYQAYSTGRNMGMLTLNDIMRSEGKPTLPPEMGDTRIAPSTMKIMGAADPSTPIEPRLIQECLQTVQTIYQLQGNLPVDRLTAKETINAVLPGASDELATGLLQSLAMKGIVQNG